MTANQLPPPETALSPRDLYAQCLARENDVLKSALTRIRLYKLLFIERPGLPPLDYRDLLELLRAARNKEERWELIARWLKQENICEPEEILPFSVSHLASKRLLSISMKDTTYASVVEIWGPYYCRLMKELGSVRELDHKLRKRLLDEGYVPEAITSALSHDEAIPAICDWLESRGIFSGQPDAGTIRNAHSRSFGGKYRGTSFFYKPSLENKTT
jgi:hypothetical protein